MKLDAADSLRDKYNIREKKKKTQAAKLTKWEQLWLHQVRWREMTPITVAPEVSNWEETNEAFGYHVILQG